MNDYSISEIREGLEQSFTVNVAVAMIDDFQRISGDRSPVHADEAYAQSRGFRGRVAHGMLSASFYSTLVGMYLPGKHALLHGIEIQFPKPVYAGDVLHISGKVTYINEAYRQIEVKALITNQDGIKVSKAVIKIGLSQ